MQIRHIGSPAHKVRYAAQFPYHTSPKAANMDRKEIAKKIREAIFNRIEEDKCIHASSIEQEVEKVLGAMSIGHYPGRGASAPSLDVHPLTLSEPPSFTHRHFSWPVTGIDPTYDPNSLFHMTADQLNYWSAAPSIDFKSGEPRITVGSCRISPELYQAMLAQVEIITHPEAADK